MKIVDNFSLILITFLLISLVRVDSSRNDIKTAKDLKTQDQKCKNPEESEMKEILIRTIDLNYDIFKELESFSFGHNEYQNSIITIHLNDSSNLHKGTKKCTRILTDNWNGQTFTPLCPHYYSLAERDNIYPFKRYHATCSCLKCFHLENYKEFECQPNYKPKIALVRGECGEDGQYSWKAAIERVATSCSCMQSTIYV